MSSSQTKPVLISNDYNNHLQKLHTEIFNLDQLISQLKKEQDDKVDEYRKVCKERWHKSGQQNKCKNCWSRNPNMSKSVQVKCPNGDDEFIYLCIDCKRHCLQLQYFDECDRRTCYLNY